MAFEDQDEENEDADSVQQKNSDQEDDSDDDADSEDDAGEEDEGAEGDEDDDSSDSDEDAPLPKTRKELAKIVADSVKEALKSKGNRDGADRRTSKKDPLPNGKRPPGKAGDPRVDAHDTAIAEMRAAEAKRQFGYENNLAPDEVDVVFRLNKKPTAKTLRDPIVKGALTGYRDAKRLKGNLPSGNARVVPVGSKDYSKMSPADQSKHFVSRRQQILDSKRNRGQG